MEFRKLKVYNLAIDFVEDIYKLSSEFPADERYGLISQLRRAAVSIALNIAEGSGCGSDAEFSRFLRISIRSLYEVDAILELSIRLKFFNREKIKEIYLKRELLGRMLGQFIKKLKA